jgi:hypothetical protein
MEHRPGFRILGFDRRVGHNCAGWIGDGASNRAPVGLAKRGGAKQQ